MAPAGAAQTLVSAGTSSLRPDLCSQVTPGQAGRVCLRTCQWVWEVKARPATREEYGWRDVVPARRGHPTAGDGGGSLPRAFLFCPSSRACLPRESSVSEHLAFSRRRMETYCPPDRLGRHL